ncbi:MAG: FAD-dependent monooxygenase, partial [Pseudomonadota bacterium]|nr:FAD-dependent monooxygenase [Pseudomonadota bacterium]
ATVYSANTLTLPRYVYGRIVFTGDAAHLLPIFGVRGCNTGMQDCNNMAWKLAFVVRGWSQRQLLDTYTGERVQAAREICEEGGKSTRFMTPPTAGTRLMRDAVLSFCLSEDFPKELLHWRTSRPHDYRSTPLNTFADADAAFATGISCGQPIRNVKLGIDDYLLDRIDAGAGFHLLLFTGDAPVGGNLADILTAAGRQAFPVIRIVIAALPRADHATGADLTIVDGEGRIAARYGAAAGTVSLLRPDLHVCARWRHPEVGEVVQALQTASVACSTLQESCR